MENQFKLEKSELIYNNYIEEHKKLADLKHKLLSELKKVSEDTKLKDHLELIDQLITPVIQYYSRNTIINMILVEKAILLKKRGILFEFTLLDDLEFLLDYEVNLFFNLMIDRLLEEDIKTLSLKVTKDSSSFYTISYSIDSSRIDMDPVWENELYQEILSKYQITTISYEEQGNITYSIFLTHKN